MAFRVPPMNAIRVFEAAARLRNFTRAGEELGMTQASVSYQIKLLEDRLGSKLFVREARQVRLTKVGEQLSPFLTETFASLQVAFDRAKQQSQQSLSVMVRPTFAVAWLLPRLSSFQRQHADISVRLDISLRGEDLLREGCDVGIMTGDGRWPGLTADLIMLRRLTPVCSPTLLASLGTVTPESLLTLPLLGELGLWRDWARTAGVPGDMLQSQFGGAFSTQLVEASAAVSGQGIALVTPELFDSDLRAGRLVRPFSVVTDETSGIWLVYHQTDRLPRNVALFRSWILSDARSPAGRACS